MKVFRFSLALALFLGFASWGHANPEPPVPPDTEVDQPQKDEPQLQKYDANKVYDADKINMKFENELANNDAGDVVRQGCFAKIYQVKLSKGKSYIINMVSNQIDSYLRLEDNKGIQLAEDDDSGGNLNARIRFSPAEGGTYRIIATSCGANETGSYTLTINQPKKLPAYDAKKVYTLAKKGLTLEQELTNTDPKDTARQGSYAKVFLVKLVKGKTYTIDMESTELDSYLRLEDSNGGQLAEDDDSGGGLNARILFTSAVDDTYRIVATTFPDEATGTFTLTVREK